MIVNTAVKGARRSGLMTCFRIAELAPILKQMTVGTLLDAIDASPSGLLQLLSALNKLISSGDPKSSKRFWEANMSLHALPVVSLKM